MSTRAQALVHSSGLTWGETPCLLYHHCDGYPENMLPLIEKAFDFENIRGWEKGRAAKVASLLCAVDPAGFEPEECPFDDYGLILHSDIEYFYAIAVINSNGGSTAEKPSWIITIYTPNAGFWDTPYFPNMTKMQVLTLCG